MTITRKERFEVWPQNADSPSSQHNQEREAVEAALQLPPGTHQIRVGGAVYLEVENDDAGLTEVDIDGQPHVRIENLVLVADGKARRATCPITWPPGPVELRFGNRTIGSLITTGQDEPGPVPPVDPPATQFVIDTSGSIGKGLDARATHAWPTVDTISWGQDWSIHPLTPVPTFGGHYQHGSTEMRHWPANFPGRILKQVNVSWAELNPERGVFDFDVLRDLLDQLVAEGYDAGMLNVRSTVVKYEERVDGVITEKNGQVTAPGWMRNAPTVQEDWKTSRDTHRRFTNLDIRTPEFQQPFFEFIDALGADGILNDPRIAAALIHGVGGFGEEFTGKQTDARGVQAYRDILSRWSAAFGDETGKMAIITPIPQEIFDHGVLLVGTGTRNGRSPNESPIHFRQYDENYSISLDENGHTILDRTGPLHATRRHYQGQNEIWDGSSKNAAQGDDRHRAYRYSVFRYLMANFTVMWAERGAAMNPEMLAWASMQIGTTPDTAPEAWTSLFRTWTYFNNDPQELNNYECYLRQREAYGATTPVHRQRWSSDDQWNAAANDRLDVSLRYIDVARIPATDAGIGFAVDPEFLPPGDHSVTVKAHYVDDAETDFVFEYTRTDGSIGRRVIEKFGTDRARSVSLFVNMRLPQTGPAFRFKGPTPVMAVRLCKNYTEKN